MKEDGTDSLYRCLMAWMLPSRFIYLFQFYLWIASQNLILHTTQYSTHPLQSKLKGLHICQKKTMMSSPILETSVYFVDCNLLIWGWNFRQNVKEFPEATVCHIGTSLIFESKEQSQKGRNFSYSLEGIFSKICVSFPPAFMRIKFLVVLVRYNFYAFSWIQSPDQRPIGPWAQSLGPKHLSLLQII